MEAFQWPSGTGAELKVYPADHPQRKLTEEYFANEVRQTIKDVRSGREYINLWLLTDSLKNLKDPSVRAGFDTWLWAIAGVLGEETCKAIGERVCREESFTLEETERLWEDYRRQQAEEYRLPKNASWEEIQKARERRERH